ncbi:MAG TPA: FAD-dependent oxidoreductase [Anaerovoracaceae bacterium]|nr:FAD-dependent oxidoreductase [Anaerovoracaceae bacterium]
MNYQKKYPHVFSPYKLGNRMIKNRIIAAPSSLICVPPGGLFTPEHIAFFELKAEGGASIVTFGESVVDESGKTKNKSLMLDNPDVLPHLAQFSKAIKRHGAIPNIELYHGGFYGGILTSNGDRKANQPAYGPSAEVRSNGEVIEEMPEEMILKIIESFARAAAFVKRAGFEMIMVHGAHGWLFNQFLSPVHNHRTDRWGGSFESRARLYVMTLEAIRKAVGPGFPIEIRMNGSECFDLIGKPGLTLEDGIHLAKILEDKCDLLNISAGIHENTTMYGKMIPSMFWEHGCNVEYAEAVKKEVKNVAISTVGAITDPDMMEEIIASGKADFIEIGRSLLADPFLPHKAELGLDKRETNTCLRCNNCLAQTVVDELSECAVNPIIMHEKDDMLRRGLPTAPKRVLIAGGGPAGMKVAIAAADRGHEVILCEKTGELGGAIKFAKYCDFKHDLYDFQEHLKYMISKAKIEVRLNTPVTPELVASYLPDVLFVAVGALPIIPGIPGIDGANVKLAENIYGNEDSVGKNVVVLGGGLVGCETAAHLNRLGRSVTVVEMRDDVAVDANDLHKAALFLEMSKGVKVVTNTSGVSISKEGLLCKDKNGKVLYPADTVICAVGYASTNPDTEKLRGAAPKVHVIGDCDRPGKVKEALYTGYFLALDL